MKNMLRPIRVGLGPSSIIVSLYTSATQMYQEGDSITDWICAFLATAVFTCTFLAGVICRPDNLELLNLIKSTFLNHLPPFRRICPQPGPANNENIDLKIIHGLLNLTAVFISIFILCIYLL